MFEVAQPGGNFRTVAAFADSGRDVATNFQARRAAKARKSFSRAEDAVKHRFDAIAEVYRAFSQPISERFRFVPRDPRSD
jgi:hypothetical protein